AGFSANDAAERNRAVIGLVARMRHIERHRHRLRNFERSGNADEIKLDACFLTRALGAGEQRNGDIVVKSPLDDQKPRAFQPAVLLARRSARLRHGLSSPVFSARDPTANVDSDITMHAVTVSVASGSGP